MSKENLGAFSPTESGQNYEQVRHADSDTPIHSRGKEGTAPLARDLTRALAHNVCPLRQTTKLAKNNANRRAVLKCLILRPQGVTYRFLFNRLPVSERRVRSYIADLRNDSIVISPGNPALIQFTSTSIEVAIREVLQYISSDWIAAINGSDNNPTQPDDQPDDPPPKSRKYLTTMAKILRGSRG